MRLKVSKEVAINQLSRLQLARVVLLTIRAQRRRCCRFCIFEAGGLAWFLARGMGAKEQRAFLG